MRKIHITMEYIQDRIHITLCLRPTPDYKPPKAIRFYVFMLDPLYLVGRLR